MSSYRFCHCFLNIKLTGGRNLWNLVHNGRMCPVLNTFVLFSIVRQVVWVMFFNVSIMYFGYFLHLNFLISFVLYILYRVGDVVLHISLVSSPMAMPLCI